MGDDDDDGEAEDSPTAQYIQQDTMKSKSDPEGSQVTRPKLETPEVCLILVSCPLLTYSPLPARLSTTSPPPGITTDLVIDNSYIRRQAHQASRIWQPSHRFIITVHRAISKSSKACQGGRAPGYGDITRLGHVRPSTGFRPHTLTLFAPCLFACAAASPTAVVPIWLLPGFRLARFADNGAR
jgi:hypothetical protein